MRNSKLMLTLAVATISACVTITPSAIRSNAEVSKITVTQDDVDNFDCNTVIKSELFPNSDFGHPFGGKLYPVSGDVNTGMYRGVTSKNNQESDFYFYFDPEEGENGNTFIRMANYNAPAKSGGTRNSEYFYNPESDLPDNFGSTSYFNVQFDYRIYADDLFELGLKDDDLLIRWQSRSSAGGKSGDIFARDIVINEIGDKTWHHIKMKVQCAATSATEHMWLFFYYGYRMANVSPTFYCDIDNTYASLTWDEEDNHMPDHGTFNKHGVHSNLLKETPTGNYANLICKPALGVSPIQETTTEDHRHTARFKGDGVNDTSMSITTNTSIGSKLLRVSFEYKDNKENGNLNLLLNGENYVTGNLANNKPFTGSNVISSVKDGKDGYKNVVMYLDTSAITTLTSVDFVCGKDSDVSIDNLSIGEITSVSNVKGNYSSYRSQADALINEFGPDYRNKYVHESAILIKHALEKDALITEYSSQAKMTEALIALQDAKANLVEKGDLNELREKIEEVWTTLAGTNQNDYTTASWLKLRDALDYAYSLKEGASWQDVFDAIDMLDEALSGLVRKE